MKGVYIIVSDEVCDEQKIVAVFDTRKGAEEFVKEENGYHYEIDSLSIIMKMLRKTK